MYIVILVTAKNMREGNKIANQLVEDRLIACTNVVKDVKSVFTWQGKTEKASEVLLIMKSRKKNLPKIIKRVKALHSYTVPEIIALPIAGGNTDYLNWVKQSCY